MTTQPIHQIFHNIAHAPWKNMKMWFPLNLFQKMKEQVFQFIRGSMYLKEIRFRQWERNYLELSNEN